MASQSSLTGQVRRHASKRGLRGVAGLAGHASRSRRRDLENVLAYAARRRASRACLEPRSPEPATRPAPPTPAESPAAATADDQPVLLARSDVSDALMRLTLSRPPGFDYRPGQHVKMGVPGLLRTYSLVSAPHQAHLEFFVELFPGGRLSERLRGLQPGAAMAVGERAKGKLQLDPGRANQLMVATVTGVAPYMSLLRDHLHRTGRETGPRRFIILHGASHADELGYAAELADMARHHPGVVLYQPTVSRPDSPRNAGWTGARGRVDTLVEPALEALGLTSRDTAVFACGNPGMIRNVAGPLRQRGFATQTEAFD